MSKGCRRRGVQACCYAFPSRTEAIASDVVIPSIFLVYHRYASVLFDLCSIYSYVSSYFSFVLHIWICLMFMCLLHWYYIMVDRIYRSCSVTIEGYETRIGLLLLNMWILMYFLAWIGYLHITLFLIFMLRL